MTLTSSTNTLTDPALDQERKRMPLWLRRPIGTAGNKNSVENTVKEYGLHTVCTEARCPNKGECFGRGRATLLILGERCSRACAFCAVGHGPSGAPDPDEPARVAASVKQLGLAYVVITSVTRDDVPDGGAELFAETVRRIKRAAPACGVEVLVPDFKGDDAAIRAICKSAPAVLAHNMETVPRLYPAIRPQADYFRSLELLRRAVQYNKQTLTKVKTGLMVGLGESTDDVLDVMRDISQTGCRMLTLGQYLQPSARQVPVARFVRPEEFEHYKNCGLKMGFLSVQAGPFVRSSYHAEESLSHQTAANTARPQDNLLTLNNLTDKLLITPVF
ncbi:MAG: lipoyl synthase [Chitinivibrionales bacterium]|nr:lipoyl synthase [Chitinivibrionales bacterium]